MNDDPKYKFNSVDKCLDALADLVVEKFTSDFYIDDQLQEEKVRKFFSDVENLMASPRVELRRDNLTNFVGEMLNLAPETFDENKNLIKGIRNVLGAELFRDTDNYGDRYTAIINAGGLLTNFDEDFAEFLDFDPEEVIKFDGIIVDDISVFEYVFALMTGRGHLVEPEQIEFIEGEYNVGNENPPLLLE